MPLPGRFITLEGIEGVGKSTNLRFIVKYLRQRDIDLVATREPGGTEAGERIRDILLDPSLSLSRESELLLMFSARREHVLHVIRPALAAGQWVISDRFTDASFAYQGGGRGLGHERIADLENWLLAGLKPELTLFFDLPVETGLARVAERSEKDRIEREQSDFFRRVRAAYQARIAADPQRFEVIDASVTLAEVQRVIAATLDRLLSTVTGFSDG